MWVRVRAKVRARVRARVRAKVKDQALMADKVRDPVLGVVRVRAKVGARVEAMEVDRGKALALVADKVGIRVVLMEQVDFVFARSVAKKSHISRELNVLLLNVQNVGIR